MDKVAAPAGSVQDQTAKRCSFATWKHAKKLASDPIVIKCLRLVVEHLSLQSKFLKHLHYAQLSINQRNFLKPRFAWQMSADF